MKLKFILNILVKTGIGLTCIFLLPHHPIIFLFLWTALWIFYDEIIFKHKLEAK